MIERREGTREPWDGSSYVNSPQYWAWKRAFAGPCPIAAARIAALEATEKERQESLEALASFAGETPMEWCERVLHVDPSTCKVNIDELPKGAQ